MTAWLICFVCMFLLDFAWARYTRAAAGSRRVASANYAVLITLLNVVVTTHWVGDPWLVVPTLLGAWVGTYAAIKGSH